MESADMYKSLVEHLPVGVIVRQHNEPNVLVANRAAQRLLDLPSATLTLSELNQLPLELDPELASLAQQQRLSPSPLQQALAGEYVNRRDIVLRGRPLHVKSIRFEQDSAHYNAVLVQPRDHRLFVESSESGDISSAELSMRDTLAFDKLISKLSSQLINAPSDQVDGHIEQALAALGDFTQGDRCYVFEFNADISMQHNSHEWVRDGITSHIDDLQDISNAQLPYFFQVIREQGLFIVDDVNTLPAQAKLEKSVFEEEDIRSLLCVGMYVGRRLVGFVGCDMVARQRHWNEADVRRFKLVGEVIAQALQSQQYLQALAKTQQQLVQANQKLQQLAGEDSLTGVANRRQFDSHLAAEIKRANRQRQPISLVMFDIDHFKRFNDSFGHLAGDDTLCLIANHIQAQFKRSGELVCRYGGEEFSVIMPGADMQMATQSAARACQAIQALAIESGHQQTPHLTVSAGVSSIENWPSHNEGVDTLSKHLLQQADQALYQAKNNGRNRVVSTPLALA